MVIGIDFDNTLVCYDRVFRQAAEKLGLMRGSAKAMDKLAIREALRATPGGEIQWQELQAVAYGPSLESAQLFPGVVEFFTVARQRRVSIFIISHKTRFPARNDINSDLHAAARQFMQTHDFFNDHGLGFQEEQVYFEPSRSAKIQRIADLGCTHFIDDLIETFQHPGFPESVAKILFDPNCRHSSPQPVRVFNSWKAIASFLFPG